MTERLAGRVAIVTGATAPMGAAIARRLARAGAAIMGVGRNEAAGRDIADSITSDGGAADFVRADVGCEDDVQASIATTLERLGRLDIVVNNAAPTDVVKDGGEHPVVDEPTATFQYMLKTGLESVFFYCKHAIVHMADGGAFVNISTAAASRAVPGMPGYAVSKAGVEALTRQVALDYGECNIRSNAIVLGTIMDSGTGRHAELRRSMNQAYAPMRMLPRPGSVEDVAAAVEFLVSDDAGYITASTLHVDGGLSAKLVSLDSSAAFRAAGKSAP